jgi:AbrB family looped-hinge helix DNA binding protein
MTYATVSSKGQITLPAGARRALGLRPRDRVTIRVDRQRIVLQAAPGILSLAGMAGRAVSRDDERAAAMDHVAGRHSAAPR